MLRIGVEVEAVVHEVGDLVAAQDMALRDLADGMANGESLGEDGVDALVGCVALPYVEPHAAFDLALQRNRLVAACGCSTAHADADDIEASAPMPSSSAARMHSPAWRRCGSSVGERSGSGEIRARVWTVPRSSLSEPTDVTEAFLLFRFLCSAIHRVFHPNKDG